MNENKQSDEKNEADVLWPQKLRDFSGRYFFTIATIIVCVFLLFGVPQIWYAFAPWGYGRSWNLSIAVIGLFLGYFLVSTIGILTGGLAFRWKTFRRPTDAAHVKPIFAAILWVVAWPNWIARNLNRKKRRVVASLMLAMGGVLGGLHMFDLGRPSFYPLSNLLLLNITWILMLPAIWFFYCNPDKWADPGEKPNVRQVIGWRIGWLCSTALLGELIWFISTLQLNTTFGYLMYTQWAVLQFVCFSILTAHTFDYLDHEVKKYPIRLVGVTLFILLQLFNLRPQTVVTKESKDPAQTTSASTEGGRPIPWITHLERRVDSVPVGPCVIVAASGGGTRAALFASLVLRGAEKETSFDEFKFSEHIVLTSSVSGGSLAVAEALIGQRHNAKRKTIRRSTDSEELVVLIENALKAQRKNLHSAPVRSKVSGNQVLEDQLHTRIEAVEYRLEEMKQLAADTNMDSWVLSDPVIHGVTTDFMAPILRGIVTPFVGRGFSLREFWENEFQWNKITNISERMQPDTGKVSPLILFNACNTAWGTRYAIGFPALPQPFFSDGKQADSKIRTRFPARCLSDTEPLHEVFLADAVRISSNFPWGFRVRTLANTNLLDGGMVDNTGIDTIHEVIRRLKDSPQGRRVISKMARKGVFLLEIDSGGKPRGKRTMATTTSGLIEPLDTLGKALHTNADVVKEHYVASIESMFREVLKEELKSQITTLPDSAGITNDDLPNLGIVAHIRFQCEDFSGSPLTPKQHRTVMTAWALDTKQKAQVIARFLVELKLFRSTIATHRQNLVSDLENLRLFDELVSTFRQEQKTNEIEYLLAADIQTQQVSPELLEKIGELRMEQMSAQAQSYEVLGPVDRVVNKGWLEPTQIQNSQDASQAYFRKMAIVQQPTRDQFEEFERDTKEAKIELATKQKKLQSEFIQKLKESREKSTFNEIQRQFDAKQFLSEQILD